MMNHDDYRSDGVDPRSQIVAGSGSFHGQITHTPWGRFSMIHRMYVHGDRNRLWNAS
jgi:hypothetical protein